MIKKIKNILLIGLVCFAVYHFAFSDSEPIIPDPITITIPSSQGTTGIVQLEDSIQIVTIYKDSIEYIVDDKYKKLYEDAQDSLEKKQLYLDAITVREYSDTIVNNEEIIIEAKASTRGTLLRYSVDYIIKEKKHTYVPEIHVTNPRLSVDVGLEVGIPTLSSQRAIIKPEIGLMRRDGWRVGYGYDIINKTHYVGLSKSFKLIK